MQALKQLAKRIPGVRYLYHSGRRLIRYLYRSARRLYVRCTLRYKGTEDIFTDFALKNTWGGKDSISGRGSDAAQTRVIIEKLPVLFRDLGISTILDIPCGDFHWMNKVSLNGVDYIGADIVHDLIQGNKEKYESKDARFLHLNLIDDELPRADLILCRDCLVHLSFKDIFLALRNISRSKSEYLLTTTFPSRKENRDILTGEWRPLNLEIPPFDFPEPLRTINEGCTEGDGAYSDKSLGLWRIEEIEKDLYKMPDQRQIIRSA